MIRTLSLLSKYNHSHIIKRMSSQCSVFVSRCKEEIPSKATEMLESKYCVSYWSQPGPITRQGLLDGVKGKTALFCLLTDKVDQEVLEAGNSLKVLATMSVGHDHLDLETIKKKGITVGYTPDVLTDATADLTVALLLATSRRLVEGSDALKNGEWGTWSPLWLCGPELKGATVGIVGFGRIGMAVMQRLKPFGVGSFLYTGRSKKEEEDGASYVSFEDLLKQSDFVILTLAYTPESKDLMDKRAFKLMKKSSILINSSRGGVVNQDDLVEALKENEIFAAGLDVMTPEPLPTCHPLVGLPNCTLIPHLGSATIQTRTEMAVMTAGNIIAGLTGQKMPAQLHL